MTHPQTRTCTLAVVVALGCVACVERPAGSAGAADIVAARREMLAAGRATAGTSGAGTSSASGLEAAIASSAGSAIPDCEHTIDLEVSPDSGRFTASASLSCDVEYDYIYLDVAAYATSPNGGSFLITAAAVEVERSTTLQTFEATGTIRPGHVLHVNSLAVTLLGDDSFLGFVDADTTDLSP